MGWTQRRRTKNGGVRYRACYRDLRGQIQAAGTFSTEREADRAWQRAETRLAEVAWATLAAAGRPSAATSPRSGSPTM